MRFRRGPEVGASSRHSLRAFLGRQPLCGTGVLSVMEITSRPPMVSPLMAAWWEQRDSRVAGPRNNDPAPPGRARGGGRAGAGVGGREDSGEAHWL